MSDVSVSPTPSQENLANIMDATMYNAIDMFMANEEQSYDNFMKQFTHFTKDDVKAEMLKKREAMFKKMKESKLTPHTEGSKPSIVPEDAGNTCAGVLPGEEELEEEVLDVGTTSSIMTGGINEGLKRSTVQFDNFVELDVSDDEDLPVLEDSGYVASFGGQKSNIKSKEQSLSHQERQTIQETDTQREETPTAITASEPSDGTSTVDSDVINPGEVEDLPSVKPVIQNDQTLDFSARFMEGAPTKNDPQECSDEVEPFSLDKDFDYDNVILTPKFSQEDVDLMKTLRAQNQPQQTDTQENET